MNLFHILDIDISQIRLGITTRQVHEQYWVDRQIWRVMILMVNSEEILLIEIQYII
jgi:hypothetical protein